MGLEPTYICQDCDSTTTPAEVPDAEHDYTHDLVLYREASLDPVPVEVKLDAMEVELKLYKNQLKEQMTGLEVTVDERILKMEAKLDALSDMLSLILSKLHD